MSDKIGIVLAEKSIQINPETFQPYLWMTIGVPLEVVRDGKAEEGIASVHEAIGRELSELINGQEHHNNTFWRGHDAK